MHLTVPLGDVGDVESRIRNHVDANFVYLEIVLILAQGSARFVSNVPQALKSF
jgi:hypothetical protein